MTQELELWQLASQSRVPTNKYCAGRVTNGAKGNLGMLSTYDDAGELAGVLTHYQAEDKVIVIVHPGKRRQGHGRRLLTACVGMWGTDLSTQVPDTAEGQALLDSWNNRRQPATA